MTERPSTVLRFVHLLKAFAIIDEQQIINEKKKTIKMCYQTTNKLNINMIITVICNRFEFQFRKMLFLIQVPSNITQKSIQSVSDWNRYRGEYEKHLKT